MELMPYSEFNKRHYYNWIRNHYNEIFKLNRELKRRKIVYSGGLSYVDMEIYSIYGFSENIKEIIETINHEINHILTEKMLNIERKSLIDMNIDDFEWMNRLLSNNNSKIKKKMSIFISKFFLKIKDDKRW